jgi:hypothetical protein
LEKALRRIHDGENVDWTDLDDRGIPAWYSAEKDSRYVLPMDGPGQSTLRKGKEASGRVEKTVGKGKKHGGVREEADVEMEDVSGRETRKRKRDGDDEEVSAKRKRVVSPKDVPSHHLEEEEVVASGSTGKKTGKGRKFTSTPVAVKKPAAQKSSKEDDKYVYEPEEDAAAIPYQTPCATCVKFGRKCYVYKGPNGLAQSGLSCAYCRMKKGKCEHAGGKRIAVKKVAGGVAAATRKKKAASPSPSSSPPPQKRSEKSAAPPSKRGGKSVAPPPSKRGEKSAAPPPSKRGGKSAPTPASPVPTPTPPAADTVTAPRIILKPLNKRSKAVRVPAAEPGEVHRKFILEQSIHATD